MSRTRAYWPTRIILAVGVIVATVVVVLATDTLGGLADPCLSCVRDDVLGVPADVLVSAVALGLAVVGILWLVRIFRPRTDEPPAWRYRDR